MPAHRVASLWVPVLLWMGVIFALSSIPSLSSGLGTADLVLRKLAHASEFAILGALLARALPDPPALVAGIAYAVTDELHQSFVSGRTGAVLDVAIDSLGVLLGILLLRRVQRKRRIGGRPASERPPER